MLTKVKELLIFDVVKYNDVNYIVLYIDNVDNCYTGNYTTIVLFNQTTQGKPDGCTLTLKIPQYFEFEWIARVSTLDW